MLITSICILKILPVFSFPTFLPWGIVFYLGSSLLLCCGSFFIQLPSKLNSPHPQTSLSLPGVQYATKVRMVKATVFLVVVYGHESWTIKKAEHWRSDAFELWCCTRLLRVPWTARKSNQSILKEINPEYSLEGLMLKLKCQFWPLDAKTQLIGKDPNAGNNGRQEETGATEDEMVGWHHWLNGHEFEQTGGDSEGQGSLVCCKESDTAEWLNNNNKPSHARSAF